MGQQLHFRVFKELKFRIIFGLILCSLFFLTLVGIISEIQLTSGRFWFGLIANIFLFLLISESIFCFNSFLSRHFSWNEKIFGRILLLILFVALCVFLVHEIVVHTTGFIPLALCYGPKNVILNRALLLFVVTLYVVMLISLNWYESISTISIENERLKQEKLHSDYFALQEQLNPHFLFNSLSTLIAMIKTDPDLAVKFAENFSDIYRYVLDHRGLEAAYVREEITYIKSWLMMQHERHGDGLKVKIDIDQEYYKLMMPPLSLQVVVENCLKHNSATMLKPLYIEIYTEDNCLVVKNNLNPKKSSYSTHLGLENIVKRYQILTTNSRPIILKDEKSFIVKLPLINEIYEITDINN